MLALSNPKDIDNGYGYVGSSAVTFSDNANRQKDGMSHLKPATGAPSQTGIAEWLNLIGFCKESFLSKFNLPKT